MVVFEETRRNCRIERDAGETFVGQTGVKDVSICSDVSHFTLIKLPRVSLPGSLTIVPQAVD